MKKGIAYTSNKGGGGRDGVVGRGGEGRCGKGKRREEKSGQWGHKLPAEIAQRSKNAFRQPLICTVFENDHPHIPLVGEGGRGAPDGDGGGDRMLLRTKVVR